MLQNYTSARSHASYSREKTFDKDGGVWDSRHSMPGFSDLVYPKRDSGSGQKGVWQKKYGWAECDEDEGGVVVFHTNNYDAIKLHRNSDMTIARGDER